jgi:glycine/D-amino acid oxidase-like deaminating enzyme
VRPATLHRRPFVGFNPQYPQVGIFNGMGTKGITLAPYFAQHFVNHIVHQHPLDVEVDVKRYFK